MATIQDDVYRLTNADPRCQPRSNSKSNSTVLRIKQHLDQYMHTFGIFDSEVTNSPGRALLTLEFLATRILALQHASESLNAAQVDSDARTSCQLLLIIHGDQDRQLVDAFNSLTSSVVTGPTHTRDPLANKTSPFLFASTLDAFQFQLFSYER